MKLLVLDNYDSFTYNLVHIINELGYGEQMDIFRNDKIAIEEVEKYDKILLSPGPGIPSEAGIMQDLIKRYAASKSILGVCLGHQGIAEAFGAEIFNMPIVLHGVANETKIIKQDEPIFEGIPKSFMACRYHSWSVLKDTMNGNLEVTAEDEHGNVMALSHRQLDVKGVQFHPESILTEHGPKMIENWLKK
ncbi:aminodeoxychorismate/anthranilate synthase component II [Fulvivirgaceae bacterium BMA10]|uniref:Aminodeoxychorismate/anthranilate synthase component II n=1 Tax=Splendidivirga corallicola TaxID=3051826 RepID=A0ABT8KGJ3_9BACT|nr:aminodeoxychorismate/anthranilate synthase component II [Fulvivirgaceae bacterium BMA10]